MGLSIVNVVVKVGLTKKVKFERRPKDLKEGRVRMQICGEEHFRQQEEPMEKKTRRKTPGVFKDQ